MVVDSAGRCVYLVSPPTPSTRGLLVIHDIFGFAGGRTQACCDLLAARGFHVALADFYDGANMPQMGGFNDPAAREWLKSMSLPAALDVHANRAFGLLKERGAVSIGALGFCWGAYVVFKLSAYGSIRAGVSCHPSLKIGRMFFGEEESEISLAKAVKCPQCMMPAGNDPDMFRDGTIAKAVQSSGSDCVVLDFPEMEHGFVCRGDLSQAAVQRDVDAALAKASEFLGLHLATAK